MVSTESSTALAATAILVGNQRRRRRVSLTLILLALAAATSFYLLTPEGRLRAAGGYLLLGGSPIAAAAAALFAARRCDESLRSAWLVFALASLSVASAEILILLQAIGLRLPIASETALAPFLLFHPLFWVAAIRARAHPADSEALTDISLDAALILGCAAIVMLRFVWEPAGPVNLGSNPLFLPMLGMQMGALGSLFFAGMLMLWQDTALPQRSAAAFVAAAAVFAVGGILVTKGYDPDPLMPGDRVDLVWIVGWALMIYAAIEGAGPPLGDREVHAGHLAERLPGTIVPAAALLLALMAVDALRRPLHAATVFALAGTGWLLALRTRRALSSARERRDERRRLAHTRALVEVSRNLACVTDVDETLHLVGEWACRLLNAPSAGIELVTPDGRMLEMRAVSNLPQTAIGMRFPVEDSYTGRVVRSGLPEATADASSDPDIHEASIRLVGHSTVAAVPLRFRDRILGVLFACRRPRPFTESDLEVLQALADQAATAIENARLFDQVRTLSLTDPLTGLANRRQLERDMEREFAAAQRGRKLTVVLFDLDNFKTYNDTRGHIAGDQLLRLFGTVLGTATRAMNLAARYGGDEFVAVLADCDAAGAEIFVSRLRRRFQQATAAAQAGDVTLSAGIAEYEASIHSVEELVLRADEALYAEKFQRTAS